MNIERFSLVMALGAAVLPAVLAAPAAVAATPAPAGSSAATPATTSLMTITEMMKAMETSTTRYGFGSTKQLVAMDPSDFADRFWPEMHGAPETLRVVIDDGQRRVVEARCSPAAEALVDEADAAHHRREREKALATYLQAAAADPTCSMALSGAAEEQLALGRPAEAETLYARAIAASPSDHRLRFFHASALLEMGRPDRAVDELVEALVLRPRFPFALATLQARSKALGIEVHAKEFHPKAFTYSDGTSVQVHAPVDEPSAFPWTAWATCKAFWIGEEAHRKARTGQAKRTFTTTEELECLAGLVSTYEAGRAEGKLEADPELDRIARIAKDGFASEFVAYEMGSRSLPWTTLLLDDAQRDRMRQYVRRYVVVSSGSSSRPE